MISKEEINKIASLARVHLTEDEQTSLADDLLNIIQYVEQISELDLSDVKPTSHVLPLDNVTRVDEASKGLDQKDIEKYAIDMIDGAFKVPKVIE